MYKISIIIPAHNEGKYIEECLNSIINQTFELNEIEVIMIDDASSDNTFEIMKCYSEKYNNFFAYKREEKSGSAGKPRNDALKYVHGKYIMFIDADDLYENDACEKLFNAIEKTSADFVTANAVYMSEDGLTILDTFMNPSQYNSQVLKISNIKDNVLPMSCSVCFKIFSTDFVRKNNLKFLEGVPAEDSYFSYSSLIKSRKAYFLNEIVYKYRRRYSENNLSTSTNFSADYFKKINSAYKAIYDKFKENNYIKYYDAYYINGLAYVLFNFITSNKLNANERIDTLEMLKWFIDVLDEIGIDACQIEGFDELKKIILDVKLGRIKETVYEIESFRKILIEYNQQEIHSYKNKFKENLKVIRKGDLSV